VKWCLAFPYAPNEPIRAEAFEIVSAFYTKHFPDIPQLVHSATPVGEPFLRAKTRNDLVRMAEQQGFDIVCLIDADTLVHPDGIRTMVKLAASGDMFLGKPFLKGVNFRLERLRWLAALPDLTGRWPRPAFSDPGAAWVVKPSSWQRAGGMDEGFRSWGGEDTAFGYLFAAFGGVTEYDARPAVKADHPQTKRWAADPDWSTTWRREAVCRHIWMNPDLASAWLDERENPGAVDDWIDRYQVNLNRRAWRPGELDR